jgi:hypothetical protein
MFTLPLTAAEYRELVDAKYRPNAETLPGWALRDKQGRTQGWHPRVPGDPHWADADAALRAFITTAKQRRNRTLLGWHVAPTEGVDDLAYLLSVTRGELNPAEADHDR